MVDGISDMLTRIRNAGASRHDKLAMPASKIKLAIAQVLAQEGFIEGFEHKVSEENATIADMEVMLSYKQISHARKEPKITGIKQISKQGQRQYVKATDIHEVRNGFGISVISTSQGVMTGRDARKKGLGGEMICEVW